VAEVGAILQAAPLPSQAAQSETNYLVAAAVVDRGFRRRRQKVKRSLILENV
jgi:hypothetical protein